MTDQGKSALRKIALRARDEIKHRRTKSANIHARLQAHPVFQSAQSVLIYVSIRSEVETRQLIDQLLQTQAKKVYIPYCDGNILRIFPLENWDQLEKRSFGLLEPKDELRTTAERIEKFTIDLTLVPGVAFDRSLNRLGYGKGYYDKLLSEVLPETYRLAIAFVGQILDSIPVDKHDIPMQEIMTEQGSVVDRSAIKTS